MKKIILVGLFSFVFIMSILSVSAEYVKFQGNWEEGETLYSNTYPNGDYTIKGKDVYPIKPIIRECTTTTICSIYNYHYEKTCVKYNEERCVLYMSKRIKDDCRKFKDVTKCTSVKVGCRNIDGTYTNQLALNSFKYSLDGLNWNPISYQNMEINSQIQFRLDIPNECSPEYYKDRAISII